jgi:hypothetical protein
MRSRRYHQRVSSGHPYTRDEWFAQQASVSFSVLFIGKATQFWVLAYPDTPVSRAVYNVYTAAVASSSDRDSNSTEWSQGANAAPMRGRVQRWDA